MSDAQSPQRLSDKTLRVHSVSPSARLLLAGNFHGKHPGSGALRIWDTQTKKNLLSLEIVGICFAAAFSPDGMRLATLVLRWTNSTYEIKIWDVVTGHELMVLGPFEIAAADKFNSTGGFVQP